MLTHKEREVAAAFAKKLWDSLSTSERWELGDALVLGTFNRLDWFTEEPPRGWLAELDKLRMPWEEGQR